MICRICVKCWNLYDYCECEDKYFRSIIAAIKRLRKQRRKYF